MTHIFKMVTAVFVGTLLLGGVACENKETEEALKVCRNDLSNEQKKEASQQTTISQLKADLSAAQAKITELTKESDGNKSGTAGKGHKGMGEKASGGETKGDTTAKSGKAEASAKGEKKEKKAKEEAPK